MFSERSGKRPAFWNKIPYNIWFFELLSYQGFRYGKNGVYADVLEYIVGTHKGVFVSCTPWIYSGQKGIAAIYKKRACIYIWPFFVGVCHEYGVIWDGGVCLLYFPAGDIVSYGNRASYKTGGTAEICRSRI